MMQPLLVVAACIFASGPRSTLGLHATPKRSDDPDFVACDYKEPCGGEPGLPYYYVADLLATVKAKADEVAAQGRTPLFVHVGADGLRNNALWTDVHLYKEVISDLEGKANTTRQAKLQRKLNLLRQVFSQIDNVRMVFVEPVASKASDFWSNVKKLPINEEMVELVTAVADGMCKQRFATLYKFDNDLISRDFHPWAFGITDGWTSMEKDRIWNPVRAWVTLNWSLPCAHGYEPLRECKGDFEKLLTLPNRTDYIQELKVPCTTMQSLAHRVGGTLDDIVMLNVDAEGHDVNILTPVASNPRLRPAFIMWEGSLAARDQGELAHLFRSRGYLVGNKPGTENRDGGRHATGDTPNVVAVPRGHSAPELVG